MTEDERKAASAEIAAMATDLTRDYEEEKMKILKMFQEGIFPTSLLFANISKKM